MTQYNTVNLKLSNSQIKIRDEKWYSGNFKTFIKCDFNDETNFQHKLL